MNGYNYVYGNPVNFVDPTGRQGCWPFDDCPIRIEVEGRAGLHFDGFNPPQVELEASVEVSSPVIEDITQCPECFVNGAVDETLAFPVDIAYIIGAGAYSTGCNFYNTANNSIYSTYNDLTPGSYGPSTATVDCSVPTSEQVRRGAYGWTGVMDSEGRPAHEAGQTAVTVSGLVVTIYGLYRGARYLVRSVFGHADEGAGLIDDAWRIADDADNLAPLGGGPADNPGIPDDGFHVLPQWDEPDRASNVLLNSGYRINPTRRAFNSSTLEITPGGRIKMDGQLLNGQYMYVVDMDGNIYFGTRAYGQLPAGVNRMPHPTLIGGHDPRVQAAGMVEIHGGKLYTVNNDSGHYHPNEASLEIAEEAFRSALPSLFDGSKELFHMIGNGK